MYIYIYVYIQRHTSMIFYRILQTKIKCESKPQEWHWPWWFGHGHGWLWWWWHSRPFGWRHPWGRRNSPNWQFTSDRPGVAQVACNWWMVETWIQPWASWMVQVSMPMATCFNKNHPGNGRSWRGLKVERWLKLDSKHFFKYWTIEMFFFKENSRSLVQLLEHSPDSPICFFLRSHGLPWPPNDFPAVTLWHWGEIQLPPGVEPGTKDGRMQPVLETSVI